MTRVGGLVERLEAPLLYGFGLAATLLGIWSVSSLMRLTALVRASMGAVALGYGLCFLLSRPVFTRRAVMRAIAGAAGVFALWQVVSSHMGDLLSGEVVSVTGDEGLIVLMVGVMVALSYTLFTRNLVLFALVPPLAAYGLMASTFVGRQITTGFIALLFAAVQVAGLAYYASRREAAGNRRARGLGVHLLVVTLVFALLLALGAAMTAGIRFVGSRYRLPLGGSDEDAILAPPPTLSPFRVANSFLGWKYNIQVATGPAQLSPEVVLQLRSPEPLYLRARVYDQFGRSSWSASGPVLAPFPAAVSGEQPVAGARRVRYSVVLEQESSLVYHAAQAVALGPWTLPEGGRAPSVLADRLGTLVTAPPLPGGTRYQAESLIRDFNPSQRHDPSSLSADSVATPGYAATSAPAVEMARQLTRDASSLEEKVQILASWVRSHADYSTEAEAYPPGVDAAAYFVEHGGEGYCDVFATAFAVMARGVGIPSHLVTGYRADTPDAATGLCLVRGTDAHAWVEIYLPGQGWVIVDPTPGAPTATRMASWWARFFGSEAVRRNAGLAISLISLAALAMLMAARSNRLRLPVWRRSKAHPAGARGLVIRHYGEASRLLGRLGIARPPAQTPGEYLVAVSGRAGGLGAEAAVPPLGLLTGGFERARYSPHSVTDEAVRASADELERLREALRQARKKGGRRKAPSSANKSS